MDISVADGQAVGKEGAGAAGPDYVTAPDALRLLGVRPQTLYAYVSRGWLRSVKQPGRRERLYALEDLEKLRARSNARRGHGAVAEGAMHWGNPIIPTAITEIGPDGPRYRTQLAIDLARGGTSFEAVAELLWSGVKPGEPVRWHLDPVPPEIASLARSTAVRWKDELPEVFALFVLGLGVARKAESEGEAGGECSPAARQIIQTVAGCFGYASIQREFTPLRQGEPMVEGLARVLGVEETDENRSALQAILILLADHELSTPAFAARMAASCGSTPLHSCIVSAICASSGTHFVGSYDRLEDLLYGDSTRAELFQFVQGMGERGNRPPGFSHPLYPKGDPRALFLLDLAKRRARPPKRLEEICRFVDDVGSKLGLYPRQELAVVTLAMTIGLPRRCAGALYILARIAGWVAHVQEQQSSGSLLRPRAKFIGA